MKISVCHVRGHVDLIDYESPVAPRTGEIIEAFVHEKTRMYKVMSVHYIIKAHKLDYVWVKVGDV